MEKGHLEQVGTPEDVYNAPRTRFVADFIGVSNFFSGQGTESRPEHLVVKTDGGLRVFLSPAEDRPNGQRMQFSVRPERISVATGETSGESENRFPGRIADKIFLGGSVSYVIALSENEHVTADIKNDSPGQSLSFALGDNVVVAWHQDDGVILAD